MSTRCFLFFIGLQLLVVTQSKPTSSDGKLISRINYLLNLTKAEEKYNNVINAYVTNDPNLSVFKSEVMSFVKKFLSFEILRPQIVQIYKEFYSLSDINGLIKFYSSTLGAKLIEKESQAEIRLTELVKSQLEKQMPQIISWFQQAMNKDYSKSPT